MTIWDFVSEHWFVALLLAYMCNELIFNSIKAICIALISISRKKNK